MSGLALATAMAMRICQKAESFKKINNLCMLLVARLLVNFRRPSLHDATDHDVEFSYATLSGGGESVNTR